MGEYKIKVYNCTGLIGGGVRDLDSIKTVNISDGYRAHVVTGGNSLSIYVYDSSSTAETDTSGFTAIRPIDYNGTGVWLVASIGIDNTALFKTGDYKFSSVSTVPTGFLEADGSAISRTTYSELFAVIGETYGSGDGSTTFEIPDCRGRFFRAFDNGAGVDLGAASRTDRGDGTTGDAVGTLQGQFTAIPTTPFVTSNPGNHAHTSSGSPTAGDTENVENDDSPNNSAAHKGSATGAAGSHTHTITSGGDAQTCPVNITCGVFIKA